MRKVTRCHGGQQLTYWYVGKRINEDVLQGERAAYGKKVIPSLAKRLVK